MFFWGKRESSVYADFNLSLCNVILNFMSTTSKISLLQQFNYFTVCIAKMNTFWVHHYPVQNQGLNFQNCFFFFLFIPFYYSLIPDCQ